MPDNRASGEFYGRNCVLCEASQANESRHGFGEIVHGAKIMSAISRRNSGKPFWSGLRIDRPIRDALPVNRRRVRAARRRSEKQRLELIDGLLVIMTKNLRTSSHTTWLVRRLTMPSRALAYAVAATR